MKKSKLLVLGLIALMLAGGLVLASCGMDCKGSEGYSGSGGGSSGVGDFAGRCYFRLSGGGSMDCKDECIYHQMKKKGSPVDLNCDC